MNYLEIKKHDVANGTGVRVSVFAAGCHHHCKGCFNPESWNFNNGKPFTEETINEILEAMNHEYISGLTLLGGEPFELVNVKGFLPLLRKVKELYPDKTIWSFTGYLFDEQILKEIVPVNKDVKEFISYLDTVVDGRFVLEKKEATLIFKGSSNQRIINVKETLKKKKIILDPLNEERLQYGKQS